MCNKRIYVFACVSILLFSLVKGSCLEYGHSCWGAHGKRSGTAVGGKLLRAAPNLNNGENDGNNALQSNKPLFEGIDEINTQSERNGQTHTNLDDGEEVKELGLRDLSKLKNLLRKQNPRFRSRNRLNEDSLEQQERFVERWRMLPIFNMKSLTKSQMGKSENELLQQPSRVFAADESLYYDFQ